MQFSKWFAKGKSVLVALNMTTSPQKPAFKLPGSGSANLRTLIATQGATSTGTGISLPPLGVFIAEVQ